ncbi:2'-5' RNA ligase [Streptomyces sp. ERV7]|uniref:RNA 2',3'-cyclic phosphodiesterase n=1 Tax=Streptomyces sp. ERV7 TaxID=1322334 RepID=UPI0007F46984|nr:RNA 2',3'-cyclic phosphodiesterase [Streptomyces sp. ERV7]OAR24124.1 2'-5' RNA ligase [Streptomyces sp. ERV7]
MRLFVAVLPPPPRLAELGVSVDELHALPGADRLRWAGRDDWHLTLAFLGEVDEALLPDLHARLARAAHRTPPFELRLHGGGRFGDKVLWAGVAGAIDALRLLAERSDAAARRAGIPMDEHRRYHPHLTLARSRAGSDLHPYVDALTPFEGTAWQTEELVLVRSRLPVTGVVGEPPRYEVVGVAAHLR